MFHRNDVQEQLYSSKIQEKRHSKASAFIAPPAPCKHLVLYFITAVGKKKRKVPSRKDWQNGSMNCEFPVRFSF